MSLSDQKDQDEIDQRLSIKIDFEEVEDFTRDNNNFENSRIHPEVLGENIREL
jgi:hypothetical protein